MARETLYYHAGVEVDDTRTIWSDHTRLSYTAAEREALKLAERHGGRGIVEYWDRAHGLCPGDCELRAGADYVGVAP